MPTTLTPVIKHTQESSRGIYEAANMPKISKRLVGAYVLDWIVMM
jgi:hypothetical protein